MESKTYMEIQAQYQAMKKTCELILRKRRDCSEYFHKTAPNQIVVLGCGSSFQLAESVALSARIRTGVASTALPGGDLMLRIEEYAPLFSGNTLVITLSRSGSTSEVLYSVRELKKKFTGVSVCSIACTNNSLIAAESDFIIDIPWSFDESVCQTRSVTNLYAAAMLFIAAVADDDEIFDDYLMLADAGNDYLKMIEKSVAEIGREDWTSAAILCDGEGFGVGEEAALAFNEIAYTHSIYKHVLDVRHGPIVLFNSKTLVVIQIDTSEFEYQKDLVMDVLKRGAQVILVSDTALPTVDGVRAQISFGRKLHPAAVGVLLLPVAQMLAYYHALSVNADPDQPDGLDAWIKL